MTGVKVYNNFIVMVTCLAVILQYISVDINGRFLPYRNISFFIVILLLLWIFCKNKFVNMDFKITSILVAPFVFLMILHLFLYGNLGVLKNTCVVILAIFTSVVVSKILGFSVYTKVLRYMTLFNVVFIAMALVCGNLAFDYSPSGYSKVLLLSYYGVNMPIVHGSMLDDSLRCGGLFGHPNLFGLVSAIGFIGIGLEKTPLKEKVFWGFVYIVAFVLTESRASVLIVISFYFIKYVISRKVSFENVIKVSLFLSLMLIAFYFLSSMRSNFSGSDITSGRSELMDIVWQVYTNQVDLKKMIGVGIGNAEECIRLETNMEIPLDNSYYPLILEMGSIGCLSWLLAIFVSIYQIEHKIVKNNICVPFFLSVFLYAFFEFELSAYYPNSIHWIVFMYSMFNDRMLKENYE